MAELQIVGLELAARVLGIVASVAVPAVMAFGLAILRKQWHLDLASKRERQLVELAQTAVEAAAQKFAEIADDRSRHAQKKASAVNWFIARARDLGVDLAADAAEVHIEAAVHRLREER